MGVIQKLKYHIYKTELSLIMGLYVFIYKCICGSRKLSIEQRQKDFLDMHEDMYWLWNMYKDDIEIMIPIEKKTKFIDTMYRALVIGTGLEALK